MAKTGWYSSRSTSLIYNVRKERDGRCVGGREREYVWERKRVCGRVCEGESVCGCVCVCERERERERERYVDGIVRGITDNSIWHKNPA